MIKNRPYFKAILFTWSVLAVPVLYGVYVDLMYRYALSIGKLPYTLCSEWLVFYCVLSLFALTGMLSIFFAFANRRLGVVISAIYLGLMTMTMLIIQSWVSCLNGDCL